MHFQCRCGRQHIITITPANLKAYALTAPNAVGLPSSPVPVAPQSTFSRTPIRAPSVESDVKTPTLQALVSGGIASLVTTSLVSCGVLLFNVPRPFLWPPLAACVVGTVTTTITWWGALRISRDLLYRVEEWAGRDLDGNGAVGEPEWWTVNGERRARRPLSHNELKRLALLRFCRIVQGRQQSGRGTGQRAMRGTALGEGFTVNDALHKEFVDLLVTNDLAEASGNGWRLLAMPDEVAEVIRTG